MNDKKYLSAGILSVILCFFCTYFLLGISFRYYGTHSMEEKVIGMLYNLFTLPAVIFNQIQSLPVMFFLLILYWFILGVFVAVIRNFIWKKNNNAN